MKIQINPSFDALYYSPYLLGLQRVFGKSSISFSRKRIPDFGHHGLAVLTERDAKQQKLFISASDGCGINRPAAEWADVYAKVNIDHEDEGDGEWKSGRLMAIGPSFPVRVWNPPVAVYRSLTNFAACGGRVGNLRRHFGSYRAQWRYRVPESQYHPAETDEEYIFFASRLWRKEPATNLNRAEFIRAGRSLSGIQFEGGFVPRHRGPVEGFEDLTVDSSFSIREYLDGVRRSLVVFNTPAVSGCLGWKLAEYLALGKAVITTPLSRALPAPLENGCHVHEVDGSRDSILCAIRKIRADRPYRTTLEENARKYYEDFLAPEAVIRRIATFAEATESRMDSG